MFCLSKFNSSLLYYTFKLAMTVQPTDTNMEVANLLVGMHDNRVQTLGQKRAFEQDPCFGAFKEICYPFPVNNEMFTANEACQILSLIDARHTNKLIDHFTEQKYIPVHQRTMYLK